MEAKIKRLALLGILCIGLASCADKEQAKPTTEAKDEVVQAEQAPTDAMAPDQEQGYVVQATSWDPMDGAKDQEGPERPPVLVGLEEGKRQKFEREARKRWKNTEIFVRSER